jgi:predicted membrane channel-forming protein YqfA (hemolysin III family)
VATLIGGCITLACLLFVVSLPIGATPFGKATRRWAFFFFLAALAPSVFVSIFQQTTGGKSLSAGSLLGTVGFLAIVSVIAYLVLGAKGLVGGKRNGASRPGSSRGGYRYDDTGPNDD